MKKLLSAIVIFVAFSSCRSDGSRVNYSSVGDNYDYNVSKLFTADGCTIYRFEDGGRAVYYSDCRGKIQADYETHSSNGKSTTTIHHNEETINNGGY